MSEKELTSYVYDWVNVAEPLNRSPTKEADNIARILRDAGEITWRELSEVKQQVKAILLTTEKYKNMRKTNNPNGRPKGAKNKTSTITKNWFQSILEENKDDLKSAFEELSPRDKWKVALNIAQYIMPKQTAVTAKIGIDDFNDDDLKNIIAKL